MVKILITGHGTYAEGMLSAIELIYGNNGNIGIINFSGDDTQEYIFNLRKNVEYDVSLIFTDIVGGTPFNESIKTMNSILDRKIFVIGGANLALMIDIILFLEGNNISREELEKRVSKIDDSIKLFSFFG